MDVFTHIHQQVQAVGLPMWAVSLTAVPCPNTPVLLILHWHGFAPTGEARRETPLPVPAARPVPGSAMQLSDPWHELAQLDDQMLDAAWRFGAWDLVREEQRACSTAGASEREALACRQAFADDTLGLHELDLHVSEAPDKQEMMRLGERMGYVRWQFRPVRAGVWQGAGQDDSLDASGSREPPCPVHARPRVGTRVCETRYRLGRQDRIFLAS